MKVRFFGGSLALLISISCSLMSSGARAASPGEVIFQQNLVVLPLEQEITRLQNKFQAKIAKTKNPDLIALTRPVVPGETAEIIVRLNYSIHCTGDASFSFARIAYQGRTIRVPLFEGTEVAEA